MIYFGSIRKPGQSKDILSSVCFDHLTESEIWKPVLGSHLISDLKQTAGCSSGGELQRNVL